MTNALKAGFSYVAKHKPNQLICGNGQVGVITGWTVKESVAKQLEKSDYAVVGQLYSPTRGIDLLIRNLLLNPHVHFLVLLNATKEDHNSGAIECLSDFLSNGFSEGLSDTGKEVWLINSDIKGYIGLDIDEQTLNKLRRNLSYILLDSKESVIDITKAYSDVYKFPWGKPKDYPLIETLPTVLPGPLYGHRVEGNTIADTWVKIIHRIKSTGTIRPTGYDGKWQELIDLVAIVTDEPENFYFPEPNYLPINKEFLGEYISQIIEDAPYKEGVKYTYGQRLRSWFERDQIDQVINKLINEIDAASAVMSLWDAKDHEKGGSPCLNHIWLRVVDNELSLTATFRSNDMFSAWPANAMGLRALQRYIRDAIFSRSGINLQVGPLITISQSAHIYSDCWENADQLIEKYYSKSKPDFYDPSGNFLIEIDPVETKILVQQVTPENGEIVSCYFGNNALKIVRDICKANPALQPEHAAYLGIEIRKAWECLRNNQEYKQDAN